MHDTISLILLAFVFILHYMGAPNRQITLFYKKSVRVMDKTVTYSLVLAPNYGDKLHIWH
jgi:hypothetical protein